jgi:hypothetical protein
MYFLWKPLSRHWAPLFLLGPAFGHLWATLGHCLAAFGLGVPRGRFLDNMYRWPSRVFPEISAADSQVWNSSGHSLHSPHRVPSTTVYPLLLAPGSGWLDFQTNSSNIFYRLYTIKRVWRRTHSNNFRTWSHLGSKKQKWEGFLGMPGFENEGQ